MPLLGSSRSTAWGMPAKAIARLSLRLLLHHVTTHQRMTRVLWRLHCCLKSTVVLQRLRLSSEYFNVQTTMHPAQLAHSKEF